MGRAILTLQPVGGLKSPDPFFIMKIQKDVELKKYTTLKIGGKAKYFVEANSKEDIIEAVKWVRRKKLPFFVLGGGSNVLVNDKGFKGVVIKMKNEKIKMKNQNEKLKTIEADAGCSMKKIIGLSEQEGMTGLEWAAGIPRITVGGAIRGNAGAFGRTMANITKEVKALDTRSLRAQTVLSKQMKFWFKDSIFKKNKNLIILSATLMLEKKDKSEVKKEVKRILQYRKTYHPQEPSAGCAFKNVILTKSLENKFKNFPEITEFIKRGEIPAAWLIEQCGLKGKQLGKAQISNKHSNFIINLGGAKASDVLFLIKLAKQKIKNKFGISLQEEIQYII